MLNSQGIHAKRSINPFLEENAVDENHLCKVIFWYRKAHNRSLYLMYFFINPFLDLYISLQKSSMYSYQVITN